MCDRDYCGRENLQKPLQMPISALPAEQTLSLQIAESQNLASFRSKEPYSSQRKETLTGGCLRLSKYSSHCASKRFKCTKELCKSASL